jgi:hypothetical protein
MLSWSVWRARKGRTERCAGRWPRPLIADGRFGPSPSGNAPTNYGSEAYWPIEEDIARRTAEQLTQVVDVAAVDYPNVAVEPVVL